MTTHELKPTRPQPACPECEKLLAVSEKSNIIGEFLEWLNRETPIVFDIWRDVQTPFGEHSEMYPVHYTIESLLAEYFGINLDKVEQERRALLEWLQEQHNDSE